MQLHTLQTRYLKNNAYLLFLSMLLLCVSIFTGKAPSPEKQTKNYSNQLQKYIYQSESDFETLLKQDSFINQLAYKDINLIEPTNLTINNQFIFIYKNNKIPQHKQLCYHNPYKLVLICQTAKKLL